ncbi:MAG TPA: HD domain-containing phosphohydrolase [Candidatus Limnocylindrales bacterium]|nr:HD domain-containing phosphohydrolase [Candidatus Limnocylindrales bacterium]
MGTRLRWLRSRMVWTRLSGPPWLTGLKPTNRVAIFRVVGVAFWALTTARLVGTYTGPRLHVDYLMIWAITGAGYLVGVACWMLPWRKTAIEPLLGAIIVGIALPVLYLSFTGSLQSHDLLSVYVAAAVFTAALLPLRTAMAAALLGAVAAALPLLAGWTAYYDRSLLVLVSVIGLLTYVQARMLGQVGAEKRKAESSQHELEDSFMATITALAASIYAKDRTSEAHSRGTAALAVAVGHRLHVDGEQLRLLEYAALLHDIGKVGLPGYVLNKPGPLNQDELRLVREAPLIAERILSSVPFLKPVTPIIRAQNEQWNGGGYPDGLIGEAIPLGARILHACAAYHAMDAERAYRPRLSEEEIVRELRAQAGRQFDPHVVDALLEVLEANEVTAIPSGAGAPSREVDGVPRFWYQQLESLEGLGTRLTERQGVPDLCEDVAASIRLLIPHDHLRILLLNGDGTHLEPAYVSEAARPEYAGITKEALRIPIGEGISGWVARSRRALVLGDAAKHTQAGHIDGTPAIRESMLAVPIAFRGHSLGVIVIVKLGLNQYTREHLRLLVIMASELAPNLAYARLLERIYQAA